jgi:hypothetical protein
MKSIFKIEYAFIIPIKGSRDVTHEGLALSQQSLWH